MNVGTAPLRIHLGEPDALPRVTLLSPCGASSRSRHHDDAPVRGSCLEALVLEGPRLQHVEESARRSVLRRARRLLRPGGTLTVPVGPEHDQYPREALQDAAWSCGFDAYIRYVAGSAVLTRPRREAPAQPLVSVLIPAYKPAFLAQALASAMAQTWPRLEIVVGDDSPDGTIAQLVAAARPSLRPGHELRSIRNEGTIGGRANYLNLFAEARGAYVKYLNDDDLLAPDCVAVMADVLMRHPDVTLVTSYRQLIDDAGAPLPDRDFNRPLADHDTVIDGRTLATKILSERTNLVGEPTTVMFRKADVEDNRPHLMSYAGRSARRNGDMSIWTTLLSRGDAAWFARPLSFFRQHAQQVQHSETFLSEAHAAWIELVTDARDTGLISPRTGKLRFAPLAPDPVQAVALTTAAEAAYATGDDAAAARDLELALAADPTSARARGDQAVLAWEADRHDDAVLGLVLALACPDADGIIARNLHDMLAALGRWEQAAQVANACGLAPDGRRVG